MKGIHYNINQVKRFYDEVLNAGDFSVCHELISEHLKFHDPAVNSPKDGFAKFKEMEHMYRRAFPNKKVKMDDIWGMENHVVVRWSCQGTHRGELQGIKPTDKDIRINGVSIYYFESGKISEIWQSWDRLALFEQIEAISPILALH
jgi:steroid delta-isomerase-like uncharacterized protein